MKNFLRSKYSFLFLVLFIVLLYVLMNKAIVPFVTKALDSSVFFEEDKEEEQLGKVKNQRTAFGLMHCKDALKEEQGLPENAEFMDDQHEAWALGNRTYVIRSSVRLMDPEKGQIEQKFACKIRLTGNDESLAENWSVMGIDYHSPGGE